MPFRLLLLLLLLSTWAHAEITACLGFYSQTVKYSVALKIGEGPRTIQGTAEEFSSQNRKRLFRELGKLSALEKIIFDRILTGPTLVTHRTSVATLVEILKDGGLYSKNELLSSAENALQFNTMQATDAMSTPRAEDLLYDASDFVFMTISASQWRGDERYGPISLVVKNSHWQKHGWGSEHSGWYYFKQAAKEFGETASHASPDQKNMDRAAELFQREIFTANDFRFVAAVRAIEHLRKLDADAALKLSSASEAQLLQWLNTHQVGYLEGKIKHILLSDIERIEVLRDHYPHVRAVMDSFLTNGSIPLVIVE